MNGRKSAAALTENKAAPEGSGHTPVQAESSAAESGVLDLQRWASNRKVAVLLTVSRPPAPPDVTPVGPATEPRFDKTA